MTVVIEELKQTIAAIAAKVRRYQGRVDRYRQNRLFENNQRPFYRELDQEGERCDDDHPGFGLQIIKRMQSSYKTCQVKLMLKKREDRFYHRTIEKDTW